MALKVMQNEVDGWDVVREDEGVALTNHPDRRQRRGGRPATGRGGASGGSGGEPVVVAVDEVHKIDDTREGMRPAFMALAGLLIFVSILIIVLGLTGSLTGFGS